MTTCSTYIKDWTTSTHERTVTEWHTEYNNTNTMCRCTRLHPPSSTTTSIFAGELINSNIIQRLPRIVLTNHLSRTLPIQGPHCWNTWQKIILELDLLRVELTNHRSRTYTERQYTQGLLRDELTNHPIELKKPTLDNNNNSIVQYITVA